MHIFLFSLVTHSIIAWTKLQYCWLARSDQNTLSCSHSYIKCYCIKHCKLFFLAQRQLKHIWCITARATSAFNPQLANFHVMLFPFFIWLTSAACTYLPTCMLAISTSQAHNSSHAGYIYKQQRYIAALWDGQSSRGSTKTATHCCLPSSGDSFCHH